VYVYTILQVIINSIEYCSENLPTEQQLFLLSSCCTFSGVYLVSCFNVSLRKFIVLHCIVDNAKEEVQEAAWSCKCRPRSCW